MKHLKPLFDFWSFKSNFTKAKGHMYQKRYICPNFIPKNSVTEGNEAFFFEDFTYAV
jgi:hypothetical protein